MWGCFENAFVNDTSLDPRPLPSLHMRRRYSALSVVPILHTNYRRFIKWHSIQQWNQFLDTFPSFSNAVGMIDGTIHRIRRPSGPLQAEFYCGDKCCHFISSQIVVDADGLIVLPFTGYSINRLLWANFFFGMDHHHHHHYCSLQVSRTHEWCPMLPESSSGWTWESQRFASWSTH